MASSIFTFAALVPFYLSEIEILKCFTFVQVLLTCYSPRGFLQKFVPVADYLLCKWIVKHFNQRLGNKRYINTFLVDRLFNKTPEEKKF